MRVAVAGVPADRERAALLWGLYACDAGSPTAATQAFRVAPPQGGLGRLAARRLEEALQRSGASAALWCRAAESAWLTELEGLRIRVAAAEKLLAAGDRPAAQRLLPTDESLEGELRVRALAVRAKLGETERHAVRLIVARDLPQRFADLFPGESVTRALAGLTRNERVLRAEAWLNAGFAQRALSEASQVGSAAATVAARAALELRRAQTALTWIRRMGETSPEGLLLRCEAERQLAWTASRGSRSQAFARLLATAERLERMSTNDHGEHLQSILLAAEALTELGRYDDAAVRLNSPGVGDLPRWEWIWRRLVYLQGRRGRRIEGLELASRSGSTRGRRVAAYWSAATGTQANRASQLEALASSGFADLPALWAAAALGRHGVEIAPVASEPDTARPPGWSADLMTLGRVADVVVAWRAALAEGEPEAREWLGVVRLAEYPPGLAIPMLLRAEPRLLTGPWSGVSRPLLEAYLPLLWRGELEGAARRAGMPPWLLAGIVRQESAWNPRARSPSGAIGLTQVLPSTVPDIARWSGRKDLSHGNLLDPATNLTLGALHTVRWFKRYGSWTVAIACHNAGERRVRDTWEEAARGDGPVFVEGLEIPETHDYVHRVVLWSEGYRLLYWPEGEPYPWT